jgi:hypothetical protein
MASFSYAKLPAYDIPTGIDQKAVDGLNNALTNYAKFQRQDRELDQKDETIGIAKSASGRAAETHAKGMEDDEIKGLALQGKRVLDLAEDDPRRLQAAQSVLNARPNLKPLLSKYGQDADKDPIGALNYFVTEAGLYKDKATLEKEDLDRKIQTARVAELTARSDAHSARGAGRMTDAETRKRKLEADILERFGPDPEKIEPQQWEELTEPGRGLIWTAAGGVKIPYENRHEFFGLAQLRKGAGSDAEDQAVIDDLSRYNVPKQVIEEALRQRAYDRSGIAKRSPGKIHSFEGGQYNQPDITIPKAKPNAPKQLTDGEKGMAVSAFQNFNSSIDKLVGPVDMKKVKRDKDGNVDIINSPRDTSKGLSAPTIAVGQWEPYGVPIGSWMGKAGFDTQVAKEAMGDAESAAMNLSYFLSGKQIGNAEQLRLAKIYVPGPMDPVEQRWAKLQRGLKFFDTLKKVHDTQGPNAVKQLIDAELTKHYGAPERKEGAPDQDAPPTPRGAAPQGEPQQAPARRPSPPQNDPGPGDGQPKARNYRYNPATGKLEPN